MSTWSDTDRTIPAIGNARSADIPKILANFKYLATLLVAGRAKGWTLSVVNGSGSAEEPQYRVWSNGVERVRATYTYATGAVTQIAWEYSDDSGTTPNATGTWVAMMTETATYDGSGNQTTGNHSGLLSWLFEWIAKFKGKFNGEERKLLEDISENLPPPPSGGAAAPSEKKVSKE